MKRFVALFCALVLTLPLFVSCGTRSDDKDSDGKTVLKVAVLESAYGKKMWEDVTAAYEADHPDIKIELTAEKNLEDVIGSKMKSGRSPPGYRKRGRTDRNHDSGKFSCGYLGYFGQGSIR